MNFISEEQELITKIKRFRCFWYCVHIPLQLIQAKVSSCHIERIKIQSEQGCQVPFIAVQYKLTGGGGGEGREYLMTRFSCGRMIRLLSHPLLPLSRQQDVDLTDGRTGGGAKSYDRKKAWPSIKHSTLSGGGGRVCGSHSDKMQQK